MLATHVFGIVLRAVDLFFPLTGRRNMHNVACDSFGPYPLHDLHVSYLHHLFYILPQ